MTSRFIRAFALWSIVWFGVSVLQQVIFVWTAFQPEFANDPKIGDFAVAYAWSSSIMVATHVFIGLSLSCIVLWTRARWACALLVLFLLFNLWSVYLQGVDVFFQPPVGDGSWQRAIHFYLRLHGTWWGVARGIGLVALVTCGAMAAACPRRVQSPVG